MTWRILRNVPKIRRVIEHLISQEKKILVKLTDEKDPFVSRVIGDRVDDGINGTPQQLFIEALSPVKEAALIHDSSTILIEFLIHENRCRFPAEYVGINDTPPHIGMIVTYPDSIEIEEKRREDRYVFVSPEFVCAEFHVKADPEKGKFYEVNVLDCSKYGLGLIVTEKDFDLIGTLKKGDELDGIRFYTQSAMVKIDGTVRHLTKIEQGRHNGSYVIGIESPDIIETCRVEDGQEGDPPATP